MAEARAEKSFDPGAPCIYGHVSHRRTSSNICIACELPRTRSNNAKNPERHLQRTRESVARRTEAVRAYQKAYYQANAKTAIDRAAAWARANPERTRDRKAKWVIDNPEKVIETRARRDALIRGAQTGDRPAYRRFVKWSRSACAIPCYWCSKRTKRGRRHLDHIIPLSKGGADAVGNLCVACPDCNQRKNAKMPEDFAGQSEIAFT